MMKTLLISQIDNYLLLDKTFYICGYANPNMRNKPKCNIKPVLITLVKNNPENRYSTGLYYIDRNCEKLLPKTENGYIITPNNYIYIFNDYESAVLHYNEEVQKIADMYAKLLSKALGNKL